jgi:hypothetical protein
MGKRVGVIFALTLLAAPLSPATAAAPNAADNALQGLGGYWRLKDKGGAKPELTAWAKAEMRKIQHQGDIDLDAVRWCVSGGMPYVMDSAGPIEIRPGTHEAAIVAERVAIPRHIYFHLQRPSADVFDFSPVGNSIGRPVGGALVADTRMFTAGVGPEGAPRTEQSRLVERFQLADGGKALRVTSTWTDPKVFAKPYVYTWTYEKLPDGYTAQEHYCDPRETGVGNYPPGADPRIGEAK